MADDTVKHYRVEIEQIDSCKKKITKNTKKYHKIGTCIYCFSAKNYDW